MEKKYKERQKMNRYPSNTEEIDGILIGGLIACILFFTVFLLVAIFFGEDTKNSCEELGGNYVVVGEEFSAALKQTIDIYGCVK